MNVNEQQSAETKLRMAEALKEIIKTKAFNKVTVSDVVNFCSINRNTFYYHFENTHDLLYYTYEQEVKNIVRAFNEQKGSMMQALKFIMDYIDVNIQLCQCSYESLGEADLKNIFEHDLNYLSNLTIEYICREKNISISEDYKSFLTFNITGMLCSQIIWFIKYNSNLDKTKYRDYVETTFYKSIEAVVSEGAAKKL